MLYLTILKFFVSFNEKYILGIKTLTIEAQDSIPRTTKNNFLRSKISMRTGKQQKTTAQTAGLETTLVIGISSRVMLKKNLNCGEAALCNGALGTVKDFNYNNNSNTVRSILIQFDNLEKVSEIYRVTLDYEFKKDIYVARSQFPITLAWALTIHKTQGLSLDSAVIDIGKDIFEPGMAYVALSRVKKLANVHLIEFEASCLGCDDLSVIEYNRLKQKFNKGNLITRYSTYMANKPSKVTKEIINENELLNSSSIKKYTKIVLAKSDKQSHQVSSILTPPITPFKTANKIKKPIGTNNINLNVLTPILTPANTFESLLANDKYIKLRNVSNACFANVTIHALLSLGEQFFSEVSHINQYYLIVLIIITSVLKA